MKIIITKEQNGNVITEIDGDNIDINQVIGILEVSKCNILNSNFSQNLTITIDELDLELNPQYSQDQLNRQIEISIEAYQVRQQMREAKLQSKLK